MISRGIRAIVALSLASALVSCASQAPDSFAPGPAPGAVTEAPAASAPVPPDPDPWPRQLQLSNAMLTVYQPQVESWQGNQLAFRAAVAAKAQGANTDTFGVIWGSARTEVDRVARQVTLEELRLTRSNFPTLPDNGAAYLSELQQPFQGAARTIALDRLEASLAASGTAPPSGVPVQNDPPQILVSNSPALLVPIDGKPVLRSVPNTQFERVINTRVLILRAQGSGTYYLHVYDGWLSASTVEGPWSQITASPSGLDDVGQQLAESGQVDLLDGGNAQPKPSLSDGVPTIYVSHVPAELLVFKGPPDFQPISGTSLLWATNTTADVLVNTADNRTYVLLSGRWYNAPSLNGPWSYVASTSLPADFRNIPASSPAAVVLVAVAGTPQAQEGVIENSIPQTATIQRVHGPTFSPVFDGSPQFRPISGTPLQYVVNSPTPIIGVDANTYYALRAGVWFTATALSGPWIVAASVPQAIYTIPVSSSLYYVTYVRVYGATPDVVYVGYTPGYLGTVVAADGVVVYGTGYTYQPWVGTMWYAPPVTYGIQAQPVYNPAVGWAYGFGLGFTTAALVDSWGAVPYYTPVYYGYPCCGSASANVYGHWGNAAYSGTRSWYATPGGTVGTTASGAYTSERTGTTGSYQAYKGRFFEKVGDGLPSLRHIVGYAMTHNRKEGSHVLPGRFRPMAEDYHAASAPSEQAPGHRVGLVELRDGAGPLVCPDRGQSLAGQRAQAQGADRTAATARMVLRHPTEAGRQAPSTPRRDLFSRLAGLGRQLVAGHATGAGHRCHSVGGTVRGVGGQCRLSRLCDPGRVGGLARQHQTCLATGMAAAAAPAAASHPPRLDRDRAGRSRLVCPVAVSTDCAPGLAPIFAHQYGRQLSAHGGTLLAALDDVCAAAWYELARRGHRLCAQPGPLHVAGPLGGRLQGPVADPDRSAAGGE